VTGAVNGEEQPIPFEDVLAEDLRDPEFRAIWERTAVARAVSMALAVYQSEHRLSDDVLAQRLGMSLAEVEDLEAGDADPDVATVAKIAERLGIDPMRYDDRDRTAALTRDEAAPKTAARA
jgi:ribosome-binding protein aMBF1 (putative translation factor)